MIHRDDALPPDLEEAGNRLRTRCEQRIAAPLDHGLVIGNEPGADEIIAAVHVRPIRTAAYAKLYQRASHYAIVGVAAALEVNGGTIASARVGLTGAGSHAQRLTNVEQALAGRPATSDTIEAAAKNAGVGVANVTADIHAGEAYRRAMIAVFAKRAISAALARK